MAGGGEVLGLDNWWLVTGGNSERHLRWLGSHSREQEIDAPYWRLAFDSSLW